MTKRKMVAVTELGEEGGDIFLSELDLTFFLAL